MGFESTRAQLLTAPPYACGAIAAVVSAYFADKVTWRMPFITGAQGLLIIAFSVLFAKAGNIEDNVAVCYFCIFLACIGIYPILPGVNAWTINNLAGAEKRAMVSLQLNVPFEPLLICLLGYCIHDCRWKLGGPSRIIHLLGPRISEVPYRIWRIFSFRQCWYGCSVLIGILVLDVQQA